MKSVYRWLDAQILGKGFWVLAKSLEPSFMFTATTYNSVYHLWRCTLHKTPRYPRFPGKRLSEQQPFSSTRPALAHGMSPWGRWPLNVWKTPPIHCQDTYGGGVYLIQTRALLKGSFPRWSVQYIGKEDIGDGIWPSEAEEGWLLGLRQHTLLSSKMSLQKSITHHTIPCKMKTNWRIDNMG